MLSGDTVIGANGEKISAFSDLQRAVFRLKVGDRMDISVVRGGKQQTLTVTLGEMPNP